MLNSKGMIKKANLSFTTMFFWLLVHNRLSLTSADNILTWYNAVLVAALVTGLEIDFAKLLITVIH